MCFIPQEGNFTRYFTGFGTIFNKPCVFYSLSLLVSFILSRLSCAGGGGGGLSSPCRRADLGIPCAEVYWYALFLIYLCFLLQVLTVGVYWNALTI